MSELNVRCVVDHFGGPSKLAEQLEAKGYGKISYKGIGNWVARNNIPNKWWLKIEALAREVGSYRFITQHCKGQCNE